MNGLFPSAQDERIYAAAALVEAAAYCQLCRVEEVLRFCDELGIRRVGVAFCIGLAEEARLLAEMLAPRLEVVSVCCKVGSVPKEARGLPKIREARFEAACNPSEQARVLEEAGTELNLIVGLCLGHDIVFSRSSAAPVTTLVVKDRVLGHNPAAALYCRYVRSRVRGELPHQQKQR